MSDDPVMELYEAQAIAIEKQLEIDRLKTEKEQLEEKLRREQEELEKKLRRKKEELEGKLRKLELEKGKADGSSGKKLDEVYKNAFNSLQSQHLELDDALNQTRADMVTLQQSMEENSRKKKEELEEKLRTLELEIGTADELSGKKLDEVYKTINTLQNQYAELNDVLKQTRADMSNLQQRMEKNLTKIVDNTTKSQFSPVLSAAFTILCLAVANSTQNDYTSMLCVVIIILCLAFDCTTKSQCTPETILVMGGGKNNNTALASMAVLSRDRTEWIEIELELPYEASTSGTVYLNGEIYLFGGFNNSKALYKLDKNMKWTRLADMNEGRNRITNSCLEWNGYIWVFGGDDEKDEELKSVERYDPKENKWTLMPDMKNARSSTTASLWNNKIIICGGWNGNGTLTESAECYNPKDNCWIEFTHLPEPVGGHSLVTYDNKLITFGGNDSSGATNAVWELDPQQSNAKWKPLRSMKCPAYFFGGIILDQEIYMIGGWLGGDIYLSRVEIFDGERWRDGPALPYTWSFMSSVTIPQTLADRLCHR